MCNLVEAIDKPIRPLVLNINRIGIPTVWSCCGYPYEGEEEEKSHAYKHAYVVFKPPTNWAVMGNFYELIRGAGQSNWTINTYYDNWRIDYKFKDGLPASMEHKEYYIQDEADKKTYGKHDYELLSIAIFNLNRILDKIPTYKEECVLIDGNKLYHEMGIDWQVKAKDDMVVKFEKMNQPPDKEFAGHECGGN